MKGIVSRDGYLIVLDIIFRYEESCHKDLGFGWIVCNLRLMRYTPLGGMQPAVDEIHAFGRGDIHTCGVMIYNLRLMIYAPSAR
jgi:hypothetical protein